MKIELSYIWSDLDNEHQFGLVSEDVPTVYNQWVWFYLGVFLGMEHKYVLYPFSMLGNWRQGKILKSYKLHTDAERQARLIANRIIKIIEK
jgi:hypothetical protein